MIGALHTRRGDLAGSFDDARRRALMDALGTAGDRYRQGLYGGGLSGERRLLPRAAALEALDLAFTLCQTPVVYVRGVEPQIALRLADGGARTIAGDRLDYATSRQIFERDGQIEAITVALPADEPLTGTPA